MTVELDFKEISLHKGINRDTLILRLRESFSSYGQRHLTLLEVEIYRREYCHNSF